MNVTEAIQRTVEHREIFHDEMLDLMRQIMSGGLSPVQIAAVMMGLRVKKETVGEITAAAQVMREFAVKVTVKDTAHLVDVVGTGGDSTHTFNISTAAAFVTAAAGARVAKHGNRAVSSKSGSADIMEALGASLTLTAEQVGRCIDEVNMGFMFAPGHSRCGGRAAPRAALTVPGGRWRRTTIRQRSPAASGGGGSLAPSCFCAAYHASARRAGTMAPGVSMRSTANAKRVPRGEACGNSSTMPTMAMSTPSHAAGSSSARRASARHAAWAKPNAPAAAATIVQWANAAA